MSNWAPQLMVAGFQCWGFGFSFDNYAMDWLRERRKD
jgi:hypothetical protein